MVGIYLNTVDHLILRNYQGRWRVADSYYAVLQRNRGMGRDVQADLRGASANHSGTLRGVHKPFHLRYHKLLLRFVCVCQRTSVPSYEIRDPEEYHLQCLRFLLCYLK